MDCLGNKAVHFYSVPCASGIYWFWDVESRLSRNLVGDLFLY